MNWPDNVVRALARGIGVLSPSCKEAARLQSAALDRKLNLFDRFGLRCHLVLCGWCRRYGQQIKFLRSAAREQAHDNPNVPARGLSPEAKTRIKQELRSGRE